MKLDTKNALKEALLKSLDAVLLKDSFTPLRDQEKYVRSHGDRTDIFQLVFLDHGVGWRVQPNAGIRYDQVEDIFHRTSGFEQKHKGGTGTVGAPLGAIAGGTARTCEFVLESMAQVDSVSARVVQAYRELGAPYFARWSTLKEIDLAINQSPLERVPQLRGGLAWFRCSTGIIVAKLVSRSNYEELVSVYTDVMTRDNKGFYLARFESLVNSLKTLAVTGGQVQ